MVYNKGLIYSIIMYALWSTATLNPTSLDELTIDINIQDKAYPRVQPNLGADYKKTSLYYQDPPAPSGQLSSGIQKIAPTGIIPPFFLTDQKQTPGQPESPSESVSETGEDDSAEGDCKCGIKNKGDSGGKKIAHGDPTEPHEYPWQVLLRFKEVFFQAMPIRKSINIHCSGTLISTETVLTARHCIESRKEDNDMTKKLEVVVGVHNITAPEAQAKIVGMKDIMVPPEAIGEDPSGLPYYDMALIFLSEPVEWSENVKPICLPEKNSSSENVEAIVTGWGSNEMNEIQEILHEANLKILPRNGSCKTVGQICATNPEKSACNGDSGGPLIKKEEGDFYSQVGIVSGGIPCDITDGKDSINMFGSVVDIVSWIKKNMKGSNC